MVKLRKDPTIPALKKSVKRTFYKENYFYLKDLAEFIDDLQKIVDDNPSAENIKVHLEAKAQYYNDYTAELTITGTMDETAAEYAVRMEDYHRKKASYDVWFLNNKKNITKELIDRKDKKEKQEAEKAARAEAKERKQLAHLKNKYDK